MSPATSEIATPETQSNRHTPCKHQACPNYRNLHNNSLANPLSSRARVGTVRINSLGCLRASVWMANDIRGTQ